MSAVIGISGFARSGKTTVANYIEAKYGVRRKHIAEPLRDMLAVLMRANGLDEVTIQRYLVGDLKEEMIPEIGATSRDLQISLGTEWGRECVHPDLWARTWMRPLTSGDRVMNDSVRFPNEEIAIGMLGGFTILIERAGTEPAKYRWGWLGRWLYRTFGLMWGVHDSERVDRLSPDFVIRNDGALGEIYAEIDRIMAIVGVGPLARADAA